jgi:hypothetical protein
LKNDLAGSGARCFAMRAVAFVCAAVALGSCGDDVDVCTNPGGEFCPVPEYTIELYAETPGNYGALQFDIRHLGDSGGFVGRNDKVDCVPLVEAIVASNYLGERETKVGMISVEGIVTPAALLRCGFRTSEELTPADFEIEVTDSSDTNSMQVEPPVVKVKSIIPR